MYSTMIVGAEYSVDYGYSVELQPSVTVRKTTTMSYTLSLTKSALFLDSCTMPNKNGNGNGKIPQISRNPTTSILSWYNNRIVILILQSYITGLAAYKTEFRNNSFKLPWLAISDGGREKHEEHLSSLVLAWLQAPQVHFRGSRSTSLLVSSAFNLSHKINQHLPDISCVEEQNTSTARRLWPDMLKKQENQYNL